MPGQTKMIIITTNEDLINKFQLNANKHTQIFDLDNHQMDLSFLNQVLFSHIFSLKCFNCSSILESKIRTNIETFFRIIRC